MAEKEAFVAKIKQYAFIYPNLLLQSIDGGI